MMQLLKQSGLVCSGINKKGEQVDTVAKYLIMAKLCFATGIIFAVLNAQVKMKMVSNSEKEEHRQKTAYKGSNLNEVDVNTDKG